MDFFRTKSFKSEMLSWNIWLPSETSGLKVLTDIWQNYFFQKIHFKIPFLKIALITIFNSKYCSLVMQNNRQIITFSKMINYGRLSSCDEGNTL